MTLATCSKAPQKAEGPNALPLSEAHKKLIRVCKEDFGYDVKVFPLENTVWVYLPLSKSFFDIKATDEGPKSSNTHHDSFTINFLDGVYSTGTFSFEYDIEPSRLYDKSYGYTYSLEELQKAQGNILRAIKSAYSDSEIVPENARSANGPKDETDYYFKYDNVPEFFVTVIADIEKGLELKTTASYYDISRTLTDPTFSEEYLKRIIVDNTIGSKKIIQDKAGTHLEIKAMTWGDFLAKQIVHRVNYQFLNTAFPPMEKVNEEIFKIVSEAFEVYSFNSFEAIRLHDLQKDTTASVEKAQLYQYKDAKPKSKYFIYNFSPEDLK